jgi:threonine/homoserine/homoserine lactone efflux protein
MPTVHTLLVFSLVAVVFVAIPGPSVLFVVAQGLRAGSRAAVAGAAGTATGAMTYVLVTAAGLSAVIASSATAFSVVHYAGAAYLCWLGVVALRGKGETEAGEDGTGGRGRRRSPWRSYRQGVVVELGNPKVALFFLALFPQFLHDSAGPAVTQVLVLGALFVAIGFLSDAFWGSLAGRLRAFKPDRRFDRATGLVYLGLGGWAAATGSRRS